MESATFTRRVLAELGHLPYLGGAGVGLARLLHVATGPWDAVLCVDDPASPLVAWARAASGALVHVFPRGPVPGRPLPNPVPQGPWDAGTVATLAAARERDLLDVTGIGLGLGAEPVRGRLRPLDALFPAGAGVGLVAVGCLADAEPALAGAGRLLARERPGVILVRDAVRDGADAGHALEAAAAVLGAAGYRLHDAALVPLDDAPARARALDLWLETAFLALPADIDAAALAGRGLCAAAPPACAAGDGESALEAALWRLLTGSPGPAEEPPPRRIGVDMLADREGFHPVERSDTLVWAWTGPRPAAALRIPVPRPGRHRLTLRLLAFAAADVVDTLRLTAGGRTLAHRVREKAQGWVIEADLLLPRERFTPVVELRFVHARTHRVGSADSRRPGLCLRDLRLDWRGPR